MARETVRMAVNGRSLVREGLEGGFSGEPVSSFSDMVFGFLEDGEGWSSSSPPESYVHGKVELDEDTEEERDNSANVEDKQKFWETQNQLLEGTLCRSSSLESRIRNATKEAVKEVQNRGCTCICGRAVDGGCRICLMREVSDRLRIASFNCAVRKTKWKNSPDIPAGEHTFLDVVDNSRSKKGSKKGEMIRVIIELNFRAEFEMARASEEYNRLVQRLPEVFVGKVERLHTLIKILCLAAKKCMKERKMHIGPWRKQRYMQAKWLSTCETSPLSVGYSGRLPKPKASMLTVDLLEKLPNMHCVAVQVV